MFAWRPSDVTSRSLSAAANPRIGHVLVCEPDRFTQGLLRPAKIANSNGFLVKRFTQLVRCFVLQPLLSVSDAAALTFIPNAAGAPAEVSSIRCESCTNAVNLEGLPIQRRSAHQATESVGDALHVAQL